MTMVVVTATKARVTLTMTTAMLCMLMTYEDCGDCDGGGDGHFLLIVLSLWNGHEDVGIGVVDVYACWQ